MSQAHAVIDFHCHHVPARFDLTAARAAPPNQKARWEAIARNLADEDLLLKDVRDGRLRARVVNIPLQLIADADGRVPHDTIVAANDHVAALVARHPDRIVGIAAVDPYDGDRAAREAERAVRELGLRGVLVDCARGELMIDAPEARPTLAAAAELGVPVFVHPVAPQPLTKQMARYGVIGTLFARGSTNAASLIALVEGGVFAALPRLQVVVTALAFGGLAMEAALASQSTTGEGAISTMRKHVFIDTMWPEPALVRTAVDLLGFERVIAGSDWPIVDHEPFGQALAIAMEKAGIPDEQRAAIAGGNVQRLLQLNGEASRDGLALAPRA
ncbi:MAG: amidohydrolase family protein [Xanthobacteraceae bacterium]|nr:amidohydrolase family protein [Xanthobacteraceae bacterium]